MDILATVLPWALSAYLVNLSIAVAASVLFLLAQRRPAMVMVYGAGGSHVATVGGD